MLSTGNSSSVRFVRQSAVFSISLMLGGLCNLIRAFFIAKALGPQGFGTWRFINLFVDYVHLASLGTQPAMQRRVPFLRGRGDLEGLRTVLDTTAGANVYCAIIYATGVFIWSFLATEGAYGKTLAMFVPVILLMAWFNYAKELSISTELYGLRSKLELYHGLLTMLFAVGLVYYGGLYGVIIGHGVPTFMVLVFLCRSLWASCSFNINWHIFWELVVTGLPIMANGMLLVTMVNADKIMIAAMANHEMLGIYSVGNSCVSILGTIPAAFGKMLFVKFAEMEGQNRNHKDIADILEKSTLALSALLAPIMSVAIAGFPIAVSFLLPQYRGGIAAGRLLIASIFFLGISLPVTNWCVSTGRFLPVLVLRGTIVTAEFVTVYLVIRSGGELELIAFCVLSAFAMFSSAMIVVAWLLLKMHIITGFYQMGKSLLPFLSVVSGIYIQDYVYPMGIQLRESQLFVSCMLGLVVSIAVSILFVYWFNRKTRVTALILG